MLLLEWHLSFSILSLFRYWKVDDGDDDVSQQDADEVIRLSSPSCRLSFDLRGTSESDIASIIPFSHAPF